MVNYLNSLREDRTKRLQLISEHSEKQIGEFYAPLLGLIEQLDTTFIIKMEMVEKEQQHEDTISRIAYEEYFLPLHKEIGEILKHKIHLLEGNIIPESVRGYFEHFTSENFYWRLKKETYIASPVEAKPFPEKFQEDMKAKLDEVIRRYESTIQELRDGARLFSKGKGQLT